MRWPQRRRRWGAGCEAVRRGSEGSGRLDEEGKEEARTGCTVSLTRSCCDANPESLSHVTLFGNKDAADVISHVKMRFNVEEERTSNQRVWGPSRKGDPGTQTGAQGEGHVKKLAKTRERSALPTARSEGHPGPQPAVRLHLTTSGAVTRCFSAAEVTDLWNFLLHA